MKKQFLLSLFLVFIYSGSYLSAQKIKTVFKLIDKEKFEKAEEKLNKLLIDDKDNALANLAKVQILSLDLEKNIKECISLLDKHHNKLEQYQGSLEAKYNIQDRFKKAWENTINHILAKSDPFLAEFYLSTISQSSSSLKVREMLQKEVLQKLKNVENLSRFQSILTTYPHFQTNRESDEIKIKLEFQEVAQNPNIKELEGFRKKYPTHLLTDSAQTLIYNIAFEDAQKKDNLKNYEQFINTYPNAPQKKQVLEKIKDLKFYTKNYLMGKFKPSKHQDFIAIPHKYKLYKKATIYLHKETYVAFIAMAAEAKKSGITLEILSGTRNFWVQKFIWEKHWKNLPQLSPIQKARKILRYSSMPGTSRHHWGTDIDINSVTPSYFDTPKGLKEYEWLVKNAGQFGFFQTFDGENSGYEEEKWHWSYRPISEKCLKYYTQKITYDDFLGYLGANMAKEVEVIKYFVQQIANNF